MGCCEILAPVGNREMLDAAILSDCDAIYVAGNNFGARAYASNFTKEELKDIISRCHFYQIKVYVTVNTLIKEDEIVAAYNFVKYLYEEDVDAIIIQDLGLASLVHEKIPDLELHASTQLNIRNLYGALFLKEIGFSRIVVSREIPYQELVRIKDQVDIELELFVHGSLCVCESGHCYLSSFIGGRSGNRGRCAQPCRKKYKLYNRKGKLIGVEDAYLSIKDLNTLKYLDEIKELGIDSLKIEGRMKKPEYVFSAVKNYQYKLEGKSYPFSLEEFKNREFTEGFQWSKDNNNLKEINREGLHKGRSVGRIEGSKSSFFITKVPLHKGDVLLLETQKGKQLQLEVKNHYNKNEKFPLKGYQDGRIGSNVHRISNQKFVEDFTNTHLEKTFVDFVVEAKLGQPLKLWAKAKGVTVKVESEEKIEPAKNAPITEESILKQLVKLGNTIFQLGRVDISLENHLFIPVKNLNEIRRLSVKKLYDEITCHYNRSAAPIFDLKPCYKSKIQGFSLEVQDKIPSKERQYAHQISSKNETIFKVPRITLSNEESIRKEIEINLKKIKGFFLEDPNELYFVYHYGKDLYCGYGFNITNSEHLKLLRKFGIKSGTLSIELNKDEINKISHVNDIEKEIIIYSPIKVMTTRYCPFSSLKGCALDEDCESCNFNLGYMKDEKGQWLKVLRKDGYSEIYLKEVLEGDGIIKSLKKLQVDKLQLNVSQEENPEEIVNYYQDLFNENKNSPAGKKNTGHYFRGME